MKRHNVVIIPMTLMLLLLPSVTMIGQPVSAQSDFVNKELAGFNKQAAALKMNISSATFKPDDQKVIQLINCAFLPRAGFGPWCRIFYLTLCGRRIG